MGNGSKITSTILAWFLGIVTLIGSALFTIAYTSVNDKIDAQGVLIEKMDNNMTELTKAINAGMTSKALIEDDIADLKEDFDEHEAKESHR